MRDGRVSVRLRRSPHVVCYWRGAALIMHNYATSDVAEATPLVCTLLHVCSSWQPLSAIQSALGTNATVTRRLVTRLVARRFLHRSDRPVDSRERAMRAFEQWNPAAGFFHTATKNVKFLSPRAADRFLQRQAREWRMPRPVKRLRGAASLALPAPNFDGEFPGVLLQRRTWRRFSASPVSAADMSTALALACGVLQWVRTVGGDVALKTSPSGGARHPIECYVAVRRVTGVRRGLYHYAADTHRLEEVRRGEVTDRLRVWLPHSEYFADAAFVLVLTAVFERQLWRYPYARAYRAALAEAGHVCQTFCLTATWLGLAPFCLMGLADSEIERDLDIDGVNETVLYVAGAGVRPSGLTWAPRPRGTLQARPNPVFRGR